MKNKDFREIQVSSTLLIVIFLGVLALGVFIFLLGVSVGKRQAAVSSPTQIVTQQIPEPVKEPSVKPTASETESNPSTLAPGGGGSQQAASQPAVDVQASKPVLKEIPAAKAPISKSPTETKKAPASPTGGLYYVQIAAFTERAQAQALADKYKKQGYTPVIDPRETSTKTWYRVRLGGYATRDRAVDLLDKLNAAAGKKTDFQIVHD
jgi:cell division septation protein DedD